MPPAESQRIAKWLHLSGAVLLILAIVFLHLQVYGGRDYREDEVNTIHAARIKSPAEIVQWMADDVHPPGWRLFADFWVDLFGTAEAITRWSSTLTNLLTYALIYQLALHLIDRRTAVYAVALLGLYGFASSGMAEFRPYPQLIALTAALHLVFYRWLHRPTPRLRQLYVALGIAAIYTHFFAFFIFPAHALFLLAFRRFERRFWLDTTALWGFIALSFSAWVLPLLNVMLFSFPDGYYVDSSPELYQTLAFRPEIVFGFLLLMSLFAPQLYQSRAANHPPRLRWHQHWGLLYPLFLLLATFVLAYLGNSIFGLLNARGLLSVVMLTVLLMALGLRLLPMQAGAILLILLYLQAPQNLAVQTSNGPYREIVQEMTAGYHSDSLVITEFNQAWRWLTPAAYFLMEFTPDNMAKERMFHLIGPGDRAVPPVYPNELKATALERLEAKLPAHQQLWLLQQGGGNANRAELQAWLNQNYALLRTTAWDQPYETTYRLSEYRRAPSSTPILHAGDHFQLYAWSLLDSVDVQPCQVINVESWWQMTQPSATPHTLSLILADSDGDGQITISNAVPANQFTTDWQTDLFYRDQTDLIIPCGIESGGYPLLLGIKETDSGKALPLRHPDGGDIGTAYYLTTLNLR